MAKKTPKATERTVLVREVWVQKVVVMAKSDEEAMDKVQEGEGQHVDNGLEYSETMDRSTWTME